MADFIISPLAISFDSIKASLQNYVNTKPENESWKDFYASSAGETIIEIAAALGAFYAYQAIVGRRESFLSVAQNYTSVLGLAQNLGYSASRGKNLQVSVNIIPNQTVTLPKWSIIGSYAEYDVVVTEDIILNKDTQIDVPVIIGNSMVETIQVTTNKLTQFSFGNPDVTDTYRLVLNETEVPHSTEIKDAINDKYVTISNVLGAMDVFYLQTGNYPYKAGDNLYLQFIQRNNLEWANFSNSNLVIDYASQINDSKLIENKTDKESIDSIRTKGPIYHETAMVIRSRKDYSKYLKLRNPQIIEANDMDIYPGLIAITYIKEDGTNLTEAEKQYWLDQIEESRPSGVAKAVIMDSILVNKTFDISLWKSDTGNIDSTMGDKIQEILSKYENKFEVTLDTHQLEHDIEQLDGVKVARVNLDEKEWKANTYFELFDTIKVNNEDYYVSEYKYFTGTEEPQWPTNVNDTVVDDQIIWKKVNQYKGLGVNSWSPKMKVTEYDYIKVANNDLFVCVGYNNITGTTEPKWTNTYTIDNQVIWQKIDYPYDAPNWENNKITKIGDIVAVNNSKYRCCNFIQHTGSQEPNWSESVDGTILDGSVEWTHLVSGSKGFELGWNEHLKLDKKITIVG